ncbi:MAG: efflux RND transporter permease subunit [Candidatus Rickettsia vulgarisii]
MHLPIKGKKEDNETIFQKIYNYIKRYAELSKVVLNYYKTMSLVVIVAITLSIILFTITPKGFFPQQDTGRIVSNIVTDQNFSFQSLVR